MTTSIIKKMWHMQTPDMVVCRIEFVPAPGGVHSAVIGQMKDVKGGIEAAYMALADEVALYVEQEVKRRLEVA